MVTHHKPGNLADPAAAGRGAQVGKAREAQETPLQLLHHKEIMVGLQRHPIDLAAEAELAKME